MLLDQNQIQSITEISNGALLSTPIHLILDSLDLHLDLDDLFKFRKLELADWHLADFLPADSEWGWFLEKHPVPTSTYVNF